MGYTTLISLPCNDVDSSPLLRSTTSLTILPRRHFPLLIELFYNKLIRFTEDLIVGKRLTSKFYAYLI
jgi:hypothetical protein